MQEVIAGKFSSRIPCVFCYGNIHGSLCGLLCLSESEVYLNRRIMLLFTKISYRRLPEEREDDEDHPQSIRDRKIRVAIEQNKNVIRRKVCRRVKIGINHVI